MVRRAECFEDLARAAMSELVRETHAAQVGIALVELDGPARDPNALHVGDESVQRRRAIAKHESTDRHLTSALEGGEKGALRTRVDHRWRVAARREHGAGRAVTAANVARD